MITFSRIVKEEVVLNDFDKCCSKALLMAVIKINGTLSLSSQGLSLTIRTENAKIASKLHKMLKGLYNPNIEFLVSRKMKLKKNNVYMLKVTKAREILDDLELISNLGFVAIPQMSRLKKDCCKRAYLAGAFLSCGSVNNPDTSNYHLEMTFMDDEYAAFVLELMNNYELHAKMTNRRNKYVVYLKSSEKIGDFLRAIGASQSVMQFESTRIDRSMMNTVNRWNNCDIANEVKTMNAANQQLNDINVIMMFDSLDTLDEISRDLCQIRIDNPESTLNEIGVIYERITGHSISKASISRRFKKVHEMAKSLMKLED